MIFPGGVFINEDVVIDDGGGIGDFCAWLLFCFGSGLCVVDVYCVCFTGDGFDGAGPFCVDLAALDACACADGWLVISVVVFDCSVTGCKAVAGSTTAALLVFVCVVFAALDVSSGSGRITVGGSFAFAIVEESLFDVDASSVSRVGRIRFLGAKTADGMLSSSESELKDDCWTFDIAGELLFVSVSVAVVFLSLLELAIFVLSS